MSDIKKKDSFSKVFMIFLTSFIAGIIFSYYLGNYYDFWMLKSGSWTTQTLKNTYQDELDLSEFWEVYNILKQEYYSAEEVSKEDLENGAIKGLVEALGDRHSEFMDPETNEKFQEILSWDFEWIGAVVEKVPLWVKVERILKGSPAKKAGILARDILIEANETDLSELDLYDAVEKIKGDAWTTVVLKVLRSGEPDFLEITVVRDKIQIPSVESEILEEGVGYIAINMYGETTSAEFKKALEEMKEKEANGLIIDVRDNGGWYLQSAVEILSEFVEDGEILVQTRYRDSLFNKNYYSSNRGIFEKKIVVLVNGNSASASEITAGALREYGKAIVVWEKTYGKGSVQQPFDITKSLLKLTIAQWFTPNGNSIEEKGITPDIEVLFEKEDYENDFDRQLEEAKKVLNTFQEVGSLQLAVDQYNSWKNKE